MEIELSREEKVQFLEWCEERALKLEQEADDLETRMAAAVKDA